MQTKTLAEALGQCLTASLAKAQKCNQLYSSSQVYASMQTGFPKEPTFVLSSPASIRNRRETPLNSDLYLLFQEVSREFRAGTQCGNWRQEQGMGCGGTLLTDQPLHGLPDPHS